MKKLGQHFLKNTAVLAKIIAALELEHGDQVIEIGPGHGELTMPLLRASEKLDCTIISIEKDHALIGDLGELAGAGAQFEIIEGDALKILPEVVAKISGGGAHAKKTSSYKIVGNIPYYITGKLLRTIGELEPRPRRAVLMIQKEVAERICAEPPHMNRLAASVQFWADAKIIARVPRNDFSPAPDVDSAVISLSTNDVAKNSSTRDKNALDAERYYRAVRGIFAQPRKNLLNNVFAAITATGKEVPKAEIAEFLKSIGVDPEGRPQNLSIEQIKAISMGKLWG